MHERTKTINLELPSGEIPPIITPNLLKDNPVLLITGTTPGAGSTCIARKIAEQLCVKPVIIGDLVRKQLGTQADEDLVERLDEVRGMLDLDEEIFTNLHQESPMVVEGKRTIIEGPKYLGDRPHVSIVLYTDPVTAAMRILRREGRNLMDLLLNDELLVKYIDLVQKRNNFHRETLGIDGLNHRLAWESVGQDSGDSTRLFINTGRFSDTEIVSQLFGKPIPLSHDQEREALIEYVTWVKGLLTRMIANSSVKVDPKERHHIVNNLERIDFQLENRLPVIISPRVLPTVRNDITNTLINLLYPIYRLLPKFMITPKGRLLVDNQSHHWAPEFYKISSTLPILKEFTTGKHILDPFAGAGTFMNYLALRGIPKSITYGDFEYPVYESHGKDSDPRYYPQYDVFLYSSLFDQLPSYFRPDCFKSIRGFVTMDAYRPPFYQGAPAPFDLIVGDPPYGVNRKEGGVVQFCEFVDSLLSYAREGGLFIIPLSWYQILDNLNPNFNIELLSEDISLGQSDLPTCFVYVTKKQ